jgi:hypothetical protein
MSTRELHSLGGTDRPGGRKRLQSNADDVSAKRPKTNDNDSDDEGQPKKKVTKGKGKKGKKPRYVSFPCEGILPGNTNLQPFGRMTAAQRAAMDINEDAKGAPVQLTP